MGKKSRRNKKNNGGPLLKGLAAVPTEAAAAPATIYDTICLLMEALNFDEILKIESEYRHLDTFDYDAVEDAYVLHAFGRAYYANLQDQNCKDRATHYYERAKERMEDAEVVNQKSLKSEIGMHLASLYSEARDMEKSISSHRWFLEHGNRHEVTANYVNRLSGNFNRFEKFEYTIEVLEGSMDVIETLLQAETNLIDAYIGCGEFLKAKAADEKRRSTDINERIAGLQSARIEEGMCNYKAAIAHSRKVVAGLQKQANNDIMRRTRYICSVDLARTLLRHSADNEAEAFAIFQEELDRCPDQLHREMILFQMGSEYRKLKKWDQSIESLHHLYLSSTHKMARQANGAMAQTYLEQYCTDSTLDIDQRKNVLCQAKMYSFRDHIVSTEMHLTQAQLFYFNDDKQQAYHHLMLYLDARLAECKLTCYTCKQRVRHGSVPFSCASCRVASYCGRKHQKMTWKNERICHKVLCPLFGYWRLAKKKEKKYKGFTNEDRREYERVFETFFESICCYGLIIISSGNLQKVDSTDLKRRHQIGLTIAKLLTEKKINNDGSLNEPLYCSAQEETRVYEDN